MTTFPTEFSALPTVNGSTKVLADDGTNNGTATVAQIVANAGPDTRIPTSGNTVGNVPAFTSTGGQLGASPISVNNNSVGIRAANPDAILHLGEGTYNPSGDSALLVSRDITASTAPHGVAVNDTLAQSVSGLGYAAFDTRVKWTGTTSYDHGVSLQSFPEHASAGTMVRHHGVVHGLTVSAGKVSTAVGVELRDPTGAGAVDNNYGLYINSLFKGSLQNWAVYTGGTTPSYFGGSINTDGIIYAKQGGGIRLYSPDNGGYSTIQVDASYNLTLTAGATVYSALDLKGADHVALHTYSGGWYERVRIDASGNVAIGTTSPTELLDVNSDAMRLRSSKTPASASAAGNAGEWCWDSNFLYVCVSTNQWKRAALSTW